jgi:hypothetical protein
MRQLAKVVAFSHVGMFDAGEKDFLHNNHQVEHLLVADANLPDFDLHNVEEGLLVSHRIYEGKSMTRQEAGFAILQYRKFLRDHKVAGMPEKFEKPSDVVDRVWHTHMCETEQYARNCTEYFGRMFHHSSFTCEGWGRGN